ncbi:MAG TPA: phosphatidylserine/phosphatidylglycerophosphate/cardiolipin synthase family protein [bacterium]|nr:phosphatidylserine/phosphatidylglycerophosphate/cardiolipin synthase family protein [bacterium]
MKLKLSHCLGPAGCLLLAVIFAVPSLSEPAAPPEPFPSSGILSIFRDDFPFFSPDGEVSPVSVPPARLGCGVKLLNRLEDNFALRFRLLEQARRSIKIQTYIFTGDEVGHRVADALVQKQRGGVDVQLIVDAYTKFHSEDREMYLDLEKKGIAVLGFEPVYLLGTANHQVLSVDDVNKRFHEKYWVIDGHAALLGGTNIANEYARYGDDPDKKWRDQDVLLTGPVVADVAAAFDSNYEYFLARREHRLPTNQVEWWVKLWWKIFRKAPPPPAAPAAPAALDVGELTAADVPVRFIRSRPRFHEDYVYQAYLHLLRNARQDILIENSYFVPNHAFTNSLLEAARRGVEITVITTADSSNDVPGIQPLIRYSYLPLMEAGVKIYEWAGDHPGHGCLHSKFAIIDGQVSVIGSFNLDPRAVYLNSEDVVLIASQQVAGELREFVDTVDLPASHEVTLDQAREWHDPKEVSAKFKLYFGIALEEWY